MKSSRMGDFRLRVRATRLKSDMLTTGAGGCPGLSETRYRAAKETWRHGFSDGFLSRLSGCASVSR